MRLRSALVLCALVLCASRVSAQAVTCGGGTPALSPTTISFTASADHNAVSPLTGIGLLTKYVGTIYKSGDSTPTTAVDLAKPTPNASNVITAANSVPQTLTKETLFCLRLDAVGPGGTGSAAPIPFGFPGQTKVPGAPTGVSLQ